MSIYVGITPDDLERLAPLLNLFFQQVIDLNTRQLPEQNPQLKHQLLLLMDEFTALGKVNILAKGISYIAGYGIRMMPIIQSPAQLYQTYGEHEAKSFMENHGCRIVYAPKDNRTAKEISEELGDTTVKGKSKSHNRKLLGTGGKSESISDQRRALLLPQEVKAIGQWKEIILLENTRPVKCDKICYYKDKTFTKRLLAAPSVPLIKTRQSAASRKNHTAASALMRGKERPISPEDVSKLNQMEWAGATNHLTDLTVPEGRLSDTAINELADKFLAGFKRPI
jgi:type IV secretion system protein VirD4